MNDKTYSLDDEMIKLRKQYLDDYKYHNELLLTMNSDDVNYRSWFRAYLIEKCNEAIFNLYQLETSFKKEDRDIDVGAGQWKFIEEE